MPSNFKPRDAKEDGRRPKQSLSEEIIKLDEEVIRLLARRSVLMQKLRKGKAHAATPAIIRSEKEIRGAWEARASKISRNPRLIRQLFGLIQDLDIQAQNTEQAYTPFNLAPARQPVDVNLPGPASSAYARLWVALAAAAGKKLVLPQVPRSAALNDCVKAFAQCGVPHEWKPSETGPAILELVGGNLPDYHNKTIFVGDDVLTFYLMAFLGAAKPGKMRFTGDVGMKSADLGALAQFMPSLGARLALVVPGSKGLPATLECSGQLPPQLEIPAGLPEPAVIALLVAALTWNVKISISLPNWPQTELKKLTFLLRPLFQALSSQVQILGDTVEYAGFNVVDLDLPAVADCMLDSVLCAPMLSLPLFAGGSVKLTGKLTNMAGFDDLLDLLKAFSLEVKADNRGVSCLAGPNTHWPKALERAELAPALHPLFWLFNARIAHKTKAPVLITVYPAGADLDLGTEFLAQAGFNLAPQERGLSLSLMDAEEFKNTASKNYGWSSPDANWGMALSLAAFMRANLKLSNPDCVSSVLPGYWMFYNGLPSPKLRTASSAAESEKPKRRRIMTNLVIEPELPPDPASEGE